MNESYPISVVPDDGLHPIPAAQYELGSGSLTNKGEVEVKNHVSPNQNQLIGGLRPRIFWLLILLISLIVISASIGGAVGGTRSSRKNTSNEAQSQVPSTTTARFVVFTHLSESFGLI
jgi:hypothetical protein